MTLPAVETRKVSKSFGPVRANIDVDFSAQPGEIHGIVGENGAGKSTLMKIIYGLYQPDAGELYLEGNQVRIGSPHDAISFGIGMVHQHFTLVEAMTVAENVMLGNEGNRFLLPNTKETFERITAVAGEFGFDLDPSARVGDLSIGGKQQVEIIKALARGARILIMDEPTAVLAEPEVEPIFKILRRLRDAGRTMLFTSHKLDEVERLCDRITVMRAGRIVRTAAKDDVSRDEIARLILGSDTPEAEEKYVPGPRGREVLRIDKVLRRHGLRSFFENVSFNLHAGEILCIVGVVGNGQIELAESVVGIAPPDSGKVMLKGSDVTREPVATHRKLGLAYITADRLADGIVPDMSVEENAFIGNHRLDAVYPGPLMPPRAIRENAAGLIREYDVRPTDPETSAKYLSGGNQQKLLVGRELLSHPQVLVAAYPTRGVDLAARRTIHRRLIDLRDAGAAILLISAELDEAFEIADRTAVMYSGRLFGPFERGEKTRADLGSMMIGAA